MIRITLVLLLGMLVTGCDVAQDFAEMGEKQAKVQKAIQDRHGWSAQVGWNIHNGVLTQVTVVFSASEVGDETVSTLERAARDGDPYPLVLLDGNMPGMDGFTVAERIREHPEIVGASIMMLTSSAPVARITAPCWIVLTWPSDSSVVTKLPT